MTDPRGPVAVAWARGVVRGEELDAVVRATLDADALLLAPESRPARRVALAALDGVRADAGALTLYLAGGDVLELTPAAAPDAPDLGALGAALLARAYALPEVTRALRAYGSRHGAPGSAHDRFFAPLVGPLRAARDHVARGSDRPWRAAEHADPGAMADALRAALAALAAERYPRQAPERRALEAELLDHAEPVLAALERLGASAAALRDAPDDGRLPHWRAWAAALGDVFACADRSWMAALPALADPRGGTGRLWRRVLRRGGAMLVVCAGGAGAPTTLRAQPEAGEVPRVIVRVTEAPDSLTARALVRLGFDVVPGRAGERLVVVDSAERERLARLGATTTVVRAPRAPLAGRRAGAPAPDAAAQAAGQAAQTTVYRPFDDPARGVRVLLDSLVRASGGRASLDTLGRSVEGRPILAVKFGPAGDAASRPNVLFMATYHAREWAATEMALRLVRYLAAPPARDARLDSLLARRDVWVVPVVNPDGYQYTFTADRLWRKNRRPVGRTAQGVPAFGVDLNRNHSSHWGLDDAGSSPLPESPVYRGTAPASEPEIQAVESFHLRHAPVVAVSYHTYSGVLLHPPGWTEGVLPGDLSLFRALGGTDERPAVRDRLPGAPIGYQRLMPAWQLYPVNGEYTDYAYERFGTLAFTPELTSGFEGATFYEFQFPDDEARLRTLFEDNLPFALDAIESAGDPPRWVSPTTGLSTPRLALESARPRVRVRAAQAPAAVTVDGAPRRAEVDALGGGRWQRRTVSDSLAARPRDVAAAVAADSARFRVLLVGGAEASDSGWVASGFSPQLPTLVGRASWGARVDGSTLRSPVFRVPSDVDSVTIALWSRQLGEALGVLQLGVVRLSRDGGRTFPERVLSVGGYSPVFYPESRSVGGVRGASLQLELQSVDLPWWVDEITVLAHLPARDASAPVVAALRSSENPVRGDRVRFSWPFAGRAGDVFVYDLTGRLVWRDAVPAGAGEAAWELGAHGGLANGAYLVLARAGADVRRHTLYVLREAR